jgi:hypothetical protein
MSDRSNVLAGIASVIDAMPPGPLNEGSLELTLQRIGERLMAAGDLDPSDLIVDVRLLEPLTDEAGDGA